MEPSPAQWSRSLVPKADGRMDVSFSSQIPHGRRRLRESRRGDGWGRACSSARVDGSGWVGLREGVRDKGEEPHTPRSPQSTEKALKKKVGKQKEWTKEN